MSRTPLHVRNRTVSSLPHTTEPSSSLLHDSVEMRLQVNELNDPVDVLLDRWGGAR